MGGWVLTLGGEVYAAEEVIRDSAEGGGLVLVRRKGCLREGDACLRQSQR